MSTNWALSSNGGVASASSTTGSGQFSVDRTNNGLRHTNNNWGAFVSASSGGGWDAGVNPAATPQWIEIDFVGSKTISELDVFTLKDSAPDNTGDNTNPALSDTFSLYGITDFKFQYWDGSAWTDVPGTTVTGNNKIWRQFSITPITTDKIRLWITGGLAGDARVVEVEAWEIVVPPTVTTTALPDGTVDTSYSQTLGVTGGTGSITWSIVAGALPTGLSLNASTGAITGTPTALGEYSFTVRATDSASAFDEQALSITINNPPPENSYDIADLVATGLAVDGDASVIQFSRATAGVWVSDVGLFYLNQELTSIYNGTSVDTIFFVPINKTADGAVACGDTSAAVSVTGVLPDFPHYPMEWEGDRLGIVTSVARSGRVRGRVQGNGEYVRNYKLQFNNRTPSAVAEFESFFSYHYPHKKFIYRNLWHEIDATFQFNSAIKGSANSRMKGDLEVAIAQVPES